MIEMTINQKTMYTLTQDLTLNTFHNSRLSLLHLKVLCNISYYSYNIQYIYYCTCLPGWEVSCSLPIASGCGLLDYLPPRMNLCCQPSIYVSDLSL